MRYLEPVAYKSLDVEFVQRFEATEPKVAGYWAAAACSTIRKTIKRHYLAVQRSTCCYCRQTIPVSHGRVWDAEHIVPRDSHPAFMFTPENLALACPDCNGPKSSKPTLIDASVKIYPTTGDAFRIVHPHFDKYADHIEKGDYAYARRSDKGEWTIINCNLMRFAGRKFGWPDPIADDRYEDLVDDAFDQDPASPEAIGKRLETSIKKAYPLSGSAVAADDGT